MYADYSIEKLLINEGYDKIIGVDEVGRGCGSGPVVACAVHIPNTTVKSLLGKVKDSKKLSLKKRESLYKLIVDSCCCNISTVGNKTIDRINILNATKLAMQNAVNSIDIKYNYVLVDGTVKLGDNIKPCRNIIKGDEKSLSIATASIIAKVFRDSVMVAFDEEYPMYDWKNNKGYLTKKHIDAIKKYGTSPYHRLSFKRVGWGN